MTFTFAPATRETAKARIGLQGPAGSGKTKTALRLAERLAQGGTIGMVDTERRSGLKYAVVPGKPALGGHVFGHMPMDSHDPRNLIEAVRAAERAGVAVLIVDSWSHFYNGRDGLLEIVEQAGSKQGSGGSFGGWRAGTAIQEDMLDALLNFNGHLIVTMRTKGDYVIEGKKVTKVGVKAVQREGAEYELDVVMDMVEGTATVTKTRYEPLNGQVIHHPGEDVAEMILEQLGQGVDPVQVIVDELVADGLTYERAMELYALARSKGVVGNGIMHPATGSPMTLEGLLTEYGVRVIVNELAGGSLTYERTRELHGKSQGLHQEDVLHPKTGQSVKLGDLFRQYGEALKPPATPVTNAQSTPSAPPVGQNQGTPAAAASGAGQEQGPTPVTAPQMRMMHACFSKVGLGHKDSRAERLRATALIIGRGIGSANELTKDEAQTLLDTLTAYGDRDNGAADFAAMVQGLEDADLRSRDDATDHAA